MRWGPLALVALAWAGLAQAYPHFQLSSDVAICASCHVAPAGGGMLTDFGRDQSEDPLSGGGNGGLLHGLVKLPGWVRVGGDVRLAGLANSPGRAEGVELLAFPMQADLSARLGTDVISAVASVGLRSIARQPADNGGVARSTPLPVLSREHYVLFRPEKLPLPLYVRAGRFFPPYGLRLADHTTYIRRDLGFDLEEEPYGLSAGAVSEAWEAHLTGYARDPLHAGGPGELGGAALAEVRAGIAAVGLSGRAAFTAVDRRLQAGPYAKVWLEGPKLLLMAEVDGVHQRFQVPGAPSRGQLAAYAGPVWIPLRGLSVGAAYQAFVEDLSVAGTAHNAVDLWASWLPISHVEVMLSARAQGIGGNGAWDAMLQLHYFL
ncbi:MAG TPA: hypothetical protein VFA20_10990 [Myxococcaceae bacterium]|nr:hypothetical protein [Myxococcaceae bacterium]